MTKKRYDGHSTEFGLWLRAQKQIDSSIGYVETNIDYVWCNYKTGEWMIIEEKRHKSNVNRWQRQLFLTIHRACKNDKKYKGFHLLMFENTSPDDGRIWLNNNEISKEELIRFLQFKIME